MAQKISCQVMLKPSSSVCNLHCDYCFYLEKKHLYPKNKDNWKMDDLTLQKFIAEYIGIQPSNDVMFIWQGGEPTLLGIQFFERVIELCKKYNQGKCISHSIQTNGILLNDTWCTFLKQHQFLVGISIDGPEDLHDTYRKNRSGKGTHSQVVQAIKRLKQYQIPFNTLTVLHKHNVQNPQRVYQYLKSIGSQHIQFIPLVERRLNTEAKNNLSLVGPDEPLANVTHWSISAMDYGKFLCDVFESWVEHDVETVFIQPFDDALARWLGEDASFCVTSKYCGHAFAMEANGDLYNCDHFVYPEHKLGNIHQQPLSIMNKSKAAIDFGRNKYLKLTPDCQSCEFLFLCYGGCPKHRFDRSPLGYSGHNYFCSAYKRFHQYTQSAFKVMANLIHNQRPASDVMSMISEKKSHMKHQAKQQHLSRNSPCPCGSGYKYKKCCL